MPKLGGRQLAEHIAAIHPGVKVLFISGYTQGAVGPHSRLDRHVAFLPKPFTAVALLSSSGAPTASRFPSADSDTTHPKWS